MDPDKYLIESLNQNSNRNIALIIVIEIPPSLTKQKTENQQRLNIPFYQLLVFLTLWRLFSYFSSTNTRSKQPLT